MTTPYDPPPDDADAAEFARAIPPLAQPDPDRTPVEEGFTPTSEVPTTDAAVVPPAVPPGILALPLNGRQLLPVSLDLLLRSETGLRAASFYIGFLVAATVGPVIALAAVAFSILGEEFLSEGQVGNEAWPAWLAVSGMVAFAGYFVATIESRVLAAAVIGATIEGRPLAIGGQLRLSRRRFWTAVRSAVLIGVPMAIGQGIGGTIAAATGDPTGQLDFAFQIIGGVVFGVPFAYALAGVVIGEVRATESVRRSWRLFRARPGLALVVAAFSLVSQFVIVFALSAGLDVTFRVFGTLGLDGQVPWLAALVASFVFAFGFGTLIFLAEAIATTPQVHAFIALTHYTHGLEAGRDPADVARGRRAWLSRPLVIGVVIAVTGLVAGIASLPA